MSDPARLTWQDQEAAVSREILERMETMAPPREAQALLDELSPALVDGWLEQIDDLSEDMTAVAASLRSLGLGGPADLVLGWIVRVGAVRSGLGGVQRAHDVEAERQAAIATHRLRLVEGRR